MPSYAEEEKAYRATQKKWNRASPSFSSKTTRFSKIDNTATNNPAEGASPQNYNSQSYGTIEYNMKVAQRGHRGPSAAFAVSTNTSRNVSRSQSPNTNAAPAAVTSEATLDVGRTLDMARSNPRWKKGPAAFRSTTPRFGAVEVEDKQVPPPPQYAATGPSRRTRGAVALLSRTPRLTPTPQPTCTAQYTPRVAGTFDTISGSSRSRPSAWAAPRSQRRAQSADESTPGQQQQKVGGLDFPNRLPIGIDAGLRKYVRHSAFHSTTPRFNAGGETNTTTPGPGTYTSRFIAHGMIA